MRHYLDSFDARLRRNELTVEGTIIEKKIKLEIQHQAGVTKVELEGKAELTPKNNLLVAGHKILFNQHTKFADDMDLTAFTALLSNEVYLEVEGLMRDDIIYAKEIEVVTGDDIDQGHIEISALVDQITDSGLVVAGHRVEFGQKTTFALDDSELTAATFAEHLVVNSKVEIEGHLAEITLEDGTIQEVINATLVSLETIED